MKKVSKALCVFALLLAPALALPAAAEELNRIVIRVNDQIVTLHEYKQRLSTEGRQVAGDPSITAEQRRERLAELPAQVFLALFTEHLLDARAHDMDIVITESEIDRSLTQMRESLQIQSEEEFRRALASQGLTYRGFRDMRAKQMRQRTVIDREVMTRVEPDEDDLRRFYRDNPELFEVPEQRRLREVVVLDSSDLTPDGRTALANRIREQLATGLEPSTAVEETSAAGQTSGVIVLGWVPAGDLAPALETAVAALEPGEWTEPVEGRGGLHILQLIEKEAQTLVGFAEVRDDIYSREKNRLSQLEYPKYLRELEEKSFVVTSPPPEAAEFRKGFDSPATGDDPLSVFQKGDDTSEEPSEG